MVTEPDPNYYKREADQIWRERKDEQIVNLQNGEATQNDRLEDHDEEIQELKEMLEGKASDRNDNGLKGEVHDLSVSLNALRAIMQPDSLGQGGVIARLKALENREKKEQANTEYKWKFWIALIGFVSAATVAFITNFDRLQAVLNHKGKTDPLETMIDNVKHPKSHHRHYVIQESPDDGD